VLTANETGLRAEIQRLTSTLLSVCDAAQVLLDDCDLKHDTQEAPFRFGVPYGPLHRLRSALTAAKRL
jgi:hypothetical protein